MCEWLKIIWTHQIGGPYPMKRSIPVLLLTLLAFGPLSTTRGQVSVLTYHNDNSRTGANTNETVLTPASVSSNIFKRLFTRGVDGYVYAQPLVAAGVNIPRVGSRNVVYADTGHVYWHARLLPKQGKTVSALDDVDCTDLIPEIGVTSTPVIDPATS